ncbi:TonB-dependent receptor family protein [Piscinibacter sp.]|uniref:TonB-dependent receptor family protein n=1 Tax=Piscinibacter sp. TaxID=1903157 RepID=UPI002CBFE6A7|nr:TonB-dependent receptor [Albitalea sp.]HUG21818.1 TonB-dependent receptor [Albitalea sp.]
MSRRWPCPSFVVAALTGSGAACAQADAPVMLDPVVVTAQRSGQSSFDAPAAISALTRETIETAGPQVNLSEALNRVPGITVLNRQNYAQDLQLSIRGFGARSTFGIRGVRLIVDGIPATMPDGQGQASTIALSSAGRIEVLRGPMAQLYGNAAGGVVQVFTEDDAPQPTVSTSAAFGPYDLLKLGTKFSTRAGDHGVTVDVSKFRTDGYRQHSDAQRGQLNARWRHTVNPSTELSVVLNAVDQPVSHDPLGLTREQWQADPRQAVPLAFAQDARKTVRQQQLGAVLEHRLGEHTVLTGRVYAGGRDLDNALSIPPGPQMAPTSSGGIVQFARGYGGAAAQASRRIPLDDVRWLQLTAGLEFDRMRENRQGYVNDGGAQGALKRDERNRVENADAFVQAAWDIAPAWTLTAGARTSRVRFRSDDRFITVDNPDDSGRVDYRAINPVAGIAWRVAPSLNLYANAGRGFETPTFTELAYRPEGTGLNTALRASRSRHAELGAKWKPAANQRVDVAVFDIATRDEIVVDTSGGGRSTFKNAGRTSRRGLELSYAGRLGDTLRAGLSVTLLRARFAERFVSGNGEAAITVPAGNRLPGTPERSLFAELVWAPTAWAGFHAAAEVQHLGALAVNDANDDAAPAATVFNLRAGWQQTRGAWRFTELIRLDNAGDKRYAGSVIVNDGNRRYFEPALPRHWTLALTAQVAFD